jgi:hypothetical protein
VLLAALAVPLALQAMQPAESPPRRGAHARAAPDWPRRRRSGSRCRARSTASSPIISGCAANWCARTGGCATRSTCRATCASSSAATTGCFLNGDGTIEQSTGKILREARIAAFADKAAALRTHLAAKGAQLVVASRRTARRSTARGCPPGRGKRRPSPNTT